MKKLFSISVVFAGVLLCLPVCSNTTNDAAQYPPSLVCLGNSLTAGYGASEQGKDDKTKSYPAFLQDSVSIPVVNAGVSGDRTSNGLERLSRDVLAKNPCIVIIELGANDLFGRVSVDITRDNLQKIIQKLNNGKRKVYVAKFFTRDVGRSMIDRHPLLTGENVEALLLQYNAMFSGLAAANPGIVLIEDIWSGVWDIHMSDFIHPNAEGYKIMANHYFKILKPYLKANNMLKNAD